MIAAVILAGGKSERMGSPKALLRFRGTTFVERILHCIDECSIPTRIVVAGRHVDEIRSHLAADEIAHGASVPVVFNSRFEMGMTTSFQVGIRALPDDTTDAVFFLVDHPLASPRTLRALLAHRGLGKVVVPTYTGRRGHPVLFSREFMDEILTLPVEVGVNARVRALGAAVIEVPVSDPGILTDVDTPADLAKLLRSGL